MPVWLVGGEFKVFLTSHQAYERGDPACEVIVIQLEMILEIVSRFSLRRQ